MIRSKTIYYLQWIFTFGTNLSFLRNHCTLSHGFHLQNFFPKIYTPCKNRAGFTFQFSAELENLSETNNRLYSPRNRNIFLELQTISTVERFNKIQSWTSS